MNMQQRRRLRDCHVSPEVLICAEETVYLGKNALIDAQGLKSVPDPSFLLGGYFTAAECFQISHSVGLETLSILRPL